MGVGALCVTSLRIISAAARRLSREGYGVQGERTRQDCIWQAWTTGDEFVERMERRKARCLVEGRET